VTGLNSGPHYSAIEQSNVLKWDLATSPFYSLAHNNGPKVVTGLNSGPHYSAIEQSNVLKWDLATSSFYSLAHNNGPKLVTGLNSRPHYSAIEQQKRLNKVRCLLIVFIVGSKRSAH
jgi:hypothetical protein